MINKDRTGSFRQRDYAEGSKQL